MASSNNDQVKPKSQSVLSVVGSILAAAIGVQSNKNRERDFENTTIWPYVIGGLIFTVGFIAVLITAVNIMIANGA